MRLTYSNKTNMYDTVGVYLDKFPSQVNSIVRFTESLREFKTTVVRIKNLEVEREGKTTGKTEAKYIAEKQLIRSAVNTASSLFTYSRKNNLTELKNIADVSERKLDRMKEVDLITKCKQIYKEAKNLPIADLANFGLTAEEIEDLNTKITAYENAASERGSAGAEKIGTGINISDLFKEADEILEEELDMYVGKFIEKDKAFYDGYFAAREIKDLGKRHKDNGEENEETGDSATNSNTNSTDSGSTTPSA